MYWHKNYFSQKWSTTTECLHFKWTCRFLKQNMEQDFIYNHFRCDMENFKENWNQVISTKYISSVFHPLSDNLEFSQWLQLLPWGTTRDLVCPHRYLMEKKLDICELLCAAWRHEQFYLQKELQHLMDRCLFTLLHQVCSVAIFIHCKSMGEFATVQLTASLISSMYRGSALCGRKKRICRTTSPTPMQWRNLICSQS